MDDSRRLDFIEGQLLATQAAIRTLITDHPDSAAQALSVQRAVERVISSALQRPVADAYVEGLQHAKLCVLPRRDPQ